jgi:hypothetical protein
MALEPAVPVVAGIAEPNRRAAKTVFRVLMPVLGLVIVLMIAGASMPSRPAQSLPQQGWIPPLPLPYRTTMKDNFRLLPCCDTGKALVFWYSVMGDREQLFKAGSASDAPIVEEGSTVAVTTFYTMDFKGSVGEFRVSTDDANTRAGLLNAVALITTAGGALGYVPALYVFPP